MCNFTKTVTVTDILSGLVAQNGQQTLTVKVTDGLRSFVLRLVSAGQKVAAHYGTNGMCAVFCDSDLSKLEVGDTIVLGVAVPTDNYNG